MTDITDLAAGTGLVLTVRGEQYSARIVNTAPPVTVELEPDPLGKFDDTAGQIVDGELVVRDFQTNDSDSAAEAYEGYEDVVVGEVEAVALKEA